MCIKYKEIKYLGVIMLAGKALQGLHQGLVTRRYYWKPEVAHSLVINYPRCIARNRKRCAQKKKTKKKRFL